MKCSLAVLLLAAAGTLLVPAQRVEAVQTGTETKAVPQSQASSAASAHDRHHRRHSNRHHHHHHRTSTKQ